MRCFIGGLLQKFYATSSVKWNDLYVQLCDKLTINTPMLPFSIISFSFKPLQAVLIYGIVYHIWRMNNDCMKYLMNAMK